MINFTSPSFTSRTFTSGLLPWIGPTDPTEPLKLNMAELPTINVAGIAIPMPSLPSRIPVGFSLPADIDRQPNHLEPKKDVKTRSFFLTIHPNVGESMLSFQEAMLSYGRNPPAGCVYLCVSVETGADALKRATEKGEDLALADRHGHMLVNFTNARSAKSVQTMFGRGNPNSVHWEIRRGTYQQAVDYIKKV